MLADIFTERYYVVDNAGKYSQILLEIEPGETPEIKKTYIYAHNQVLAQHHITYDTETPPSIIDDDIYYYLHDRLGSVRMLIDDTGAVENYYTYDPFGTLFGNESSTTAVENPYRFAGYFWDDEIKQYYCRARMYDPELQRFTSIDPVRGGFTEPLTLHQYLYCLNNPVNNWDPEGRMAEALGRAAWRFERFVNYDMPRVQLLGHVTLRIAAITMTYLAGREAIIFYGEHFATRAGDRNIPRIPPNQDRVKDTPRLRPKELPKGPPKPVKPPKPKKYPWWVWVLRAAGFSDDAIELIIKNSL